MNEKINIAFWGTPELTCTYLEALREAGMMPVVIITNPDRPKGRGHELAAPAPKVWASHYNIPVLQPEKLDDSFYTELASYNLTVSVVVAYGSILPERFITLPAHATLNVHYSLLPKFRGASPIEAAILAGEKTTGCAIQIMQKTLDSGDVIAQEELSIGADETTPELRNRLTALGSGLLVQTLPIYIEGACIPVPQDSTAATFCGKIKKEDGLINPEADGKTNYQKFLAYSQWPRIYFFVEKEGKKERVIITAAHLEKEHFVIDKVLPEGKKEITYSDYLKTHV